MDNVALKEYIEKSELRSLRDDIKVRMSPELAIKYDAGEFEGMLEKWVQAYEQIKSLNIKYPDDLTPILYIYIFPMDNYVDLLNIPKVFDNGNGGGKPVKCYDSDGYVSAYGTTENMLDKKRIEWYSIMSEENNVHELAHLVHSKFYNSSSIICEGFAEAIPLYGLNYEERFDKHREVLLNLKEEDILTVAQMYEQQRKKEFGKETSNTKGSCSFRYSYISSYLIIRGCLELIESKYNLSRSEAIQKLLDTIKTSKPYHESVFYDIADIIDLDHDEIINGKSIQFDALKSISLIEEQNKKITM
jgi:hypothetical protein